jgi:hypothetical protein
MLQIYRTAQLARATMPARYAALKPASMFTTATFDAQLLSMERSADTPPKFVP